MFSQVCNHYYITLFITITSDVLIKIFKNLIIFLVCGFQGTYLTDILSVIRTLNVFKTLITGKISFLIWRPPTLPHRLQCSTIGRLRLNHRVRDGNGCFPQAHRHQKSRVLNEYKIYRRTNLVRTLFRGT